MCDKCSNVYLVNPIPKVASGKRAFLETDAIAPETGIYRVMHTPHRLPHEVLILKGEHLPRCAGCSTAVLFELVHVAHDLCRGFQYRIYELPVIEEADATSI
jgi:hypothetical protein